jgi:hypothetical protein
MSPPTAERYGVEESSVIPHRKGESITDRRDPEVGWNVAWVAICHFQFVLERSDVVWLGNTNLPFFSFPGDFQPDEEVGWLGCHLEECLHILDDRGSLFLCLGC